MKTSNLIIDDAILSVYPDTLLGYLVAGNLRSLGNHELDKEFQQESEREFVAYGISQQNYAEHPTLAQWRRVYLACGVKPKTFKPSIESLALRFLKDGYKPIIPIVDVYNYVSLRKVLPMGGYDLEKLQGDLRLRFATDADTFTGINGKQDIQVLPEHIIYADDAVEETVVCWQWNHKDGRRTMLTSETDTGLFTIDSCIQSDHARVEEALNLLSDYLNSAGAKTLQKGTISKVNRQVAITY